ADVNISHWKFVLAVLAGVLAGGAAYADGPGDPAVASSDNGKYADKDGNPTYKISGEGVVDWYTFSGFRRYHSDCHVCHGPNGDGSSLAPALANSMKTMSYNDFANIVTNGRKNVNTANDKVMPAFGTNANVMCYLVDPNVFRACGDPRNMPFSNDKGEGFENKLAELFAAKLGKKLNYTYFPQATGFVRMTLSAYRCDVIIGFPLGDDQAQATIPYYRTTYALVTKRGSGLEDVTAIDDPKLKDKRIGVVARTPPSTNMAMNGLM